MTHTVSVILERNLAALNRAVGVLRRFLRTFEDFTAVPISQPGFACLTVTVEGEEATVDTMLRKMRKLSGVRDATRHSHSSHGDQTPMSQSGLRVYYDADAELERLRNRTVAVIGYGSQGHAHALNLRDSGVKVVVGLRAGGESWKRAAAEGLDVRPVAEAAGAADIVMMLVPDQHGRSVYELGVAPHITPGKTLMFAHGFNVHFHEIAAPPGVDVSMVAPKSPGHLVRSEFQAGRGVPALVAIEQDASGAALADALAYARGIGCTRAGVIPTTFRQETESDLFGEQVVLCGGVTALIQGGFETLVEAGYTPELAYFECLHELKLIVDLMARGGMKFMRYSISDTAEYGDYTRGPRIVTPAVREEMKKILSEIQSGAFAREWIAENRTGGPNFARMREEHRTHMIEQVGAKLRAMMPWTEEGKAAAAEGQPASNAGRGRKPTAAEAERIAAR